MTIEAHWVCPGRLRPSSSAAQDHLRQVINPPRTPPHFPSGERHLAERPWHDRAPHSQGPLSPWVEPSWGLHLAVPKGCLPRTRAAAADLSSRVLPAGITRMSLSWRQSTSRYWGVPRDHQHGLIIQAGGDWAHPTHRSSAREARRLVRLIFSGSGCHNSQEATTTWPMGHFYDTAPGMEAGAVEPPVQLGG